MIEDAQLDKALPLLFENAAEAMFISNKLGVIQRVNKQFLTFFGYEREQVLGQSVDMLLPGHLRNRHKTLRKSYAENAYERPMGSGFDDFVAQRADGKVIPVEISLSPVVYDGSPGLILGTVSDNTQRKRLEAQVREANIEPLNLDKERNLLESRQRLIALLSHEFRNALSVVILTATTLERKYTDMTVAKQRGLIHKLVKQIKMLQELTNDVLEMQRSQEPGSANAHQAFDLAEMLHYWRDEFTVDANSDHQFDLRTPETLLIRADRHAIGYIVRNLINNAVKYSPAGGAITCMLEKDAHGIILSISDEGVGIPQEAIPHVFKPYWRADNVAHMQGTGLGLAIVKHYVDLHGGAIYCASQENHGTTFKVHLPLEEAVSAS